MQVVDLFAGCGGMSLGFQNAGFEIIAAFDNWDTAINIYEKNFNHPVFNVDLAKSINILEFIDDKPDVIIGGPPCQDFSSAGKRNEAERANLTVSFAELVLQVSPKFFIMENVEGIIKSSKIEVIRQLFNNAGYGLTEKILNAGFCGVPQLRKRFFMIGVLSGKNNELLPYLEAKLDVSPLTLNDYLGNSLGIEYYYRHPRSYERRAIFSIYEPSPTIRGVNRPIPPNYKFHDGDAIKEFDKVRALTSIERGLIQTFPSTFDWGGIAKSQLEQAIGNAVPVKLAEYVANALNDYCVANANNVS